VDEVSQHASERAVVPFNSPIEIGLRALAILTDAFPAAYSLQRLVIFDYLLVHSDDLPNGPKGLHPKPPRRSAELLVRRNVVQQGLLLYQSRGLIERRFEATGLFFAATERSAGFVDALSTDYASKLRDRAAWIVANLGNLSDHELQGLVDAHLGEWGAEFEMESVLWAEEAR
jgi:hypothetical protein